MTPLLRTAAKKLRTASGRSATGNAHHSSHAGVRGATRSVGTSRQRASSRVRWRIRVKPATAAVFAAGGEEGAGEEDEASTLCSAAMTRCHEAKSRRVW